MLLSSWQRIRAFIKKYESEKKPMFVKFRVHNILERAIEDGIELGMNRAHKHTDTPDHDLIKQKIEDAIMEQLWEVIDMTESIKVETMSDFLNPRREDVKDKDA
ncbi:MAG TPA: hypothetical protein PK513_08780 [Alphaproteobacteria bacterium]|nr:hypothetical protein [Alphaproteobacteria bacterium]HOO82584.1 hypothetical protein [Alphaproteobacteria bacterium]